MQVRALANTPADIALGRDLVREYVVATAQEMGEAPDTILPYIPDYHDFAGRYFGGGGFLVGTIDDEIAGCVGITPLDAQTCEMNRLWVRPAFRRTGAGRSLAESSLAEAARLGFSRMVLDVLPIRTTAIALYRSLGFEDVPVFHDYAFPMVALARELSPTGR